MEDFTRLEWGDVKLSGGQGMIANEGVGGLKGRWRHKEAGSRGVKAGRIGDAGSDEVSANEDMGCRLEGAVESVRRNGHLSDIGQSPSYFNKKSGNAMYISQHWSRLERAAECSRRTSLNQFANVVLLHCEAKHTCCLNDANLAT